MKLAIIGGSLWAIGAFVSWAFIHAAAKLSRADTEQFDIEPWDQL